MNQEDTPVERKTKFDAAFNSILNNEKVDQPNWIAGIKYGASKDYLVSSPIDISIQFGRFQRSEADLPQSVMPNLVKAHGSWSSTSVEERRGILEQVRERVQRQRYRLAAVVSISAGMTETESLFEVERLLDVIETLHEEMEPPMSPGKGPWAVLASYNSPLAGPMSYALSALMAGNAVFLVPPHECPAPCFMTFNAIATGKLAEALSIATDPDGAMRRNLMDHPDIAGVAVCGSGELVDEAMFTHVDDELGFVAEIKGMNPALVAGNDNMDEVAVMVLKSAFSYSGQRMDSCSKVVVLEDHAEEFVSALLKNAEVFKVGDPADSTVDTGPLASPERLDEFTSLIRELGGKVLHGGKVLRGEFLDEGQYVQPAILMGLEDEHEFNCIDHSLPFLSVQTAKDMDEALGMIDACETGISAGVFSSSQEVVERFLAEMKADVAYVNSSNNRIAPGTRAMIAEFL